MLDCKPSILLLSSANPTIGPGVIADDIYKAFRQAGYEIDLLTLNKCESRSEYIYLQDPHTLSRKLLTKWHIHIDPYINKIWGKFHHCSAEPKPGFHFFYKKEENPPVKISKLLSKVNKNYDLVIVLFWQGMLSFASIRALYRKTNACFIFACVDYSPMAGGCHFTGDCSRYMTGCGYCTAFQSNDPYDFTWHNIQYRKAVYDEVKPIVTGNSYMASFYNKSFLLKNIPRIKSAPIIDLMSFRPYAKDPLYQKYNISKTKKYKILFGCQSISDERKGIKYLVDAINKFSRSLSFEERAEVLIMSIGKDFSSIKEKLEDLDTLDFGYVSSTELPSIYSFADVFLCSSVNDAGPMMVSQSICCGTPVVGFEMGICLDVVKNQGTGYCAKLRDSDDLANGIKTIYKLSDEERRNMQDRCIDLAHETYSFEAAVKRFVDGYHLYKNKYSQLSNKL